MSDKRMREIAGKFQGDMAKLGLGVSISVGGGPAKAVTTYCEKPGHGVSPGGKCLKCAAGEPEAKETT